MTKISKKLTAALLAFAAAVCLTLGVLFAVPKNASAAAVEPDVTLSSTENSEYLKIENGEFLGLQDKDSENTAADLLAGKTFAVSLPAEVTKIGAGLVDSNNIQRSIFGGYSGSLVKFTISSSVESIGDYAFYKCSSLVDITIPASVKTIGKQAFQDCTSLEGLYYANLSGSLATIGEAAFFGCTSLKSITIPVNVTKIGETAFSGCSSVETINYYAKAASAMAKSPFENTGSAEVVIGQAGNAVTLLPAYLFANTKIKKVTFENVQISLETGMGTSAFENCTYLTEVTFSENCSLKAIREKAFRGCSSLSKINLEAVKGLETIGAQAFQNCSSLLSVTIPSTVKDTVSETLTIKGIGTDAFSGCTALLEVRNESALAVEIGDKDKNGGLGYNAKYIYKGDNSHMVSAGDYTFFYYENESDSTKKTEVLLVSYSGESANLQLPESVTLDGKIYNAYKINKGAFRNNALIQSVKIPSAVTAIGESAFYGCTSLGGIVIPATVDEVGNYAFYGCTSLETAVIEDSVSGMSNISASMFGNCTSLKEIIIPQSIINIYSSAFSGCTALESVTFNTEKLNRIDSSAFSGCTSLKTVRLPDAPRYAGDGAFSDCGDELILIAPGKDAYNDYKDKTNFYGNNVLTYEIKLELHSGTETEKSVLYFGVKAELPLQEGYETSVWYENDSFNADAKVDKTALNEKLNDSATDTIILYAKDTPKPQGVAAKSNLTYSEGGWATSDGSLYVNWGNDYNVHYKVVVSRYLNAAGEVTEVADKTRIKDAGTYYLSILINDKDNFGQWEEGVPVTVRVVPALLTSAFEDFEWGVAKDNRVNDLYPSGNDELKDIYVYEGKPYFEKQYDDSDNELNHEEDYIYSVHKSYLDYISSVNDYELVLKGDKKYGGSSEYIEKVVYLSGNKGKNWGVYTASAIITLDNNYRLPTGSALDGTSLKEQGITIEQGAALNEFSITKTWFIVATDGNKLLSQDGESSYRISDWTYSYNGNKVIDAPVLMYGEATDENVHYVLGMFEEENGVSAAFNFEFDHSEFSLYVNEAMPAAYYVLTVTIDESTYKDKESGADKISAGAVYTFRFKVDKAEWNTLIKDDDGNGYIDSFFDSEFLKTRTLYADYTNEKTFGDVKSVMPVLTLKPEQIHPLKLRAETIWIGEEFNSYYTGFVITYRLYGAGGSYSTADAYTNAPVDIGKYVLNYNIAAPSYNNSAYDNSSAGRNYNLYIQGTIGAPQIYVEYTGESWAYNINFNSKYFEVVYLDEGSVKAKTIKRELIDSGIQDLPELDRYITAGSHKVVLIFHDEYKTLAKWNENEFSKIINGSYGTYAVFTFNIAQATNEATQSPRITWWTWGSYNEKVNVPLWSTKFTDGIEYDFILESADGSKVYYYIPDPDDERKQGFDKADAGDYWLKPIASGTGNVKEFNTRWLTEDDGEWFFVHIEKATVDWAKTSVPKIDSWKYGEDKNYSEPNGILDEMFSDLQGKWTNYFCLHSDYTKILAGDNDVTTYPTFEALKQAGDNGFVAAGQYVYVYKLDAADEDNFKSWEEVINFSVLKADNYWDITPVIHDWAYGDNTSVSINYKPHFGSVKDVQFQYRFIDENGVPSGWVDSISKLFDKSGNLPIGKYEYTVSMEDTANYETNPFNDYFYVTRNINSWEKIPNVVGWSDGGYKAEKNMPEASARFGTVYFTVIDSKGNAVSGLERLTADELNAEKLNSLGVGTYKLVAEVDETVNYEKLYAEATFAVFEDSVGMTGIIAATAVFAVIAVGLAVAGVILLIRKNKKIEEEFRKMVNSELKRR